MQTNRDELVKSSKVTLANAVSKSLRATIPNDVTEYLGIESGDVIEWETFTDKGKRYARIRKLQ